MRVLQDRHAPDLSVHIGFYCALARSALPRLITELAAARPAVAVYGHEVAPERVAAAVDVGDLQVGLIRAPLPDSCRLRVEEVDHEPVVLAVTPDHPLGGAASVSLATAAQYDWVILDRSSGPTRYDAMMRHLLSAGLRPRAVVEADGLNMAVGLASAGVGALPMPASVAETAPGLRSIVIQDWHSRLLAISSPDSHDAATAAALQTLRARRTTPPRSRT